MLDFPGKVTYWHKTQMVRSVDHLGSSCTKMYAYDGYPST
jgi:hypothetical protein